MNSSEIKSVGTDLQSITVGGPTYFSGLTIFPLFRTGSAPAEPGYTLLEDAIKQGTALVTELGDGGSVPELRFENAGEKPVLLLDGEELLGAKQNRIVNLTILAPAKQVIVIPVSCVEAHRWHQNSEELRPAQHVMYSRARADKAAQVSASMAAGDSRRSDQSAIWADIASKSERLGTDSPTQAMNAMYDNLAGSIDAYLCGFAWQERQTGLIFAMGSKTMGLDLVDHPDTMRALFPKLIRSCALDAVETPNAAASTAAEAAEFLHTISRAELLARPAVGIGEEIRLTGKGMAGAALRVEHRYVHLCAFTSGNGDSSGTHTRMSRPTRRRTRP